MRRIASKSKVLNLLPGHRLVVLGLEVAVGVVRWWGVAVVVVGDQIRGLCCGPHCGNGGGGRDGCGLGQRFGRLDLGVWVRYFSPLAVGIIFPCLLNSMWVLRDALILWLSTWLRVTCEKVVSIYGTLFLLIVMVSSLQWKSFKLWPKKIKKSPTIPANLYCVLLNQVSQL